MAEGGVYENPWLYEGKHFTSDDIDDFFGFVYRIINLQNGREYIGRKFSWGNCKRSRIKRKNDWQNKNI